MAASHEHSTVFDSAQQHLGTVYAKALLGAAQQAGHTDQVLEEFDAVVDLLGELPQLDQALISPRVPEDAKLRLLDKALGSNVSSTMIHFLKVIVRHGRMNCLRAIRLATHRLFNEATGRVEVLVRTATPLDAATAERVTQKLTASLGKKVVLNAQVDESLLGGIVIRIGDTLLDGSLATRLVRLREGAASRVAAIIREKMDRFLIAE